MEERRLLCVRLKYSDCTWIERLGAEGWNVQTVNDLTNAHRQLQEHPTLVGLLVPGALEHEGWIELDGFLRSHGGIIFTLADTAFAYACNSRGGRAVAFQCSITFLEPGAIGDTLVARAREVLRSGRTGLYDVEVTAGSRTIAAFRGHSRHSEQAPEIKSV